MGEVWSPNTPPEITAPTISAIGITDGSIAEVAIGIIIVNVPHDVPVEKAINPESKKINEGIRTVAMFSLTKLPK